MDCSEAHTPKMHFTNSEIPPLGIGTRRQAADHRLPIQHLMALNHPSSSLQFFNQSGHGGSEMQTLIKLPPPEVAQMDDLSAVVTKCTNPNVFAKLYPYPGLIPRSGCGSVNSIPDIYSQDSIDSDNNRRAHCMHRKIGAKSVQPMPQFPPNERRGHVEDAEDLKYKPLKRNRCGGGPETSAGVSERLIHIFSERQRRSGMNQLLSKMRSMLPDQTAKVQYYLLVFSCTELDLVMFSSLKIIKSPNSMKIGWTKITFQRIKIGESRLYSLLFAFSEQLTDSGQWCYGNFQTDKISIVAETINYIHYLQQRLRTRNKKLAGGAETAGSSHQPCPFSGDAILSTTGPSDSAILPEISLKSHAGKDLFVTIKCANKENLLPSIILVMEGQNLEVMDAFVSTSDTVAFHSLHLKALHTLDAAGRKALTDTLHMLIKSEHQIIQ